MPINKRFHSYRPTCVCLSAGARVRACWRVSMCMLFNITNKTISYIKERQQIELTSVGDRYVQCTMC